MAQAKKPSKAKRTAQDAKPAQAKKMVQKRKTASERKTEIIEATLQLSDEQGPDRLSIEAIAIKVGISQPGVLRHFPKKQDIWEAVANHLISMMSERWEKILSSDMSPIQQLRALTTAQLGLIQATPAIPAILLSRELQADNKILRNTFFVLMKGFHGHINRLIAEETSFRKDLDPADATLLIVGTIQSTALRWSISGRSFDLVEKGEHLLKVLLDGFIHPPTK